MNPAHAPFLADISANPDDDTPRLIFADWLEDHGDADRAEFIRLQCEIAKLDEYDSRRADLVEREEDLLARHRDRWLAELPADLCEIDDYTPCFRRGFPESVDITCATFVERGGEFALTGAAQLAISDIGKELPSGDADEAMDRVRARIRARRQGQPAPTQDASEVAITELAACPHLALSRNLSLSGNDLTADHLAILLHSPHLSALDELNLSNKVGARGAALVAQWPGAARLRRLSFFFSEIGPEGMTALAKSPHLGNVTRLQLHGCHIGTSGAEALARSKTLTRLTELQVGYNRIAQAGIAALVRSPNLANVEELTLAYNGPQDNGLGNPGMAELAASPVLTKVRKLDLGESQITAVGISLLAGAAHFATLRWLELDHNEIGAEGIRHLAQSPYLAGLRDLSLNQCDLDDDALITLSASPGLRLRQLDLYQNERLTWEGVAALARSHVLDCLEELKLTFCPIGDAALVALSRGACAASLRKLDLLQANLSDEGIEALARATMPRLRTLELGANAITDRGGVALAKSPLLASVRKLSLGSTQISDATAIALAASPHARNLRDLSLGHSQITDVGARALAESPNLDAVTHLIVWSNPLTQAGHEALWARFGDDVYPQRRQLGQGG